MCREDLHAQLADQDDEFRVVTVVDGCHAWGRDDGARAANPGHRRALLSGRNGPPTCGCLQGQSAMAPRAGNGICSHANQESSPETSLPAATGRESWTDAPGSPTGEGWCGREELARGALDPRLDRFWPARATRVARHQNGSGGRAADGSSGGYSYPKGWSNRWVRIVSWLPWACIQLSGRSRVEDAPQVNAGGLRVPQSTGLGLSCGS